jgi:parvulin-like peptidyl-prolyl isomerase
MRQIDKLIGAKAIVQTKVRMVLAMMSVAVLSILIAACGQSAPTSSSPGTVDPNETAAKVNGKVITMEEVDRAVKQQAQGQESKLSPLELAAARLQVLQTLIEQEVMYQKAEKENLVPADDEVTGEVNKQKVDSHMSAEEFDKKMKEAGFDDKSYRDRIKKGLAIQKLNDRITSRVETPKDSEIESFYKGNPEMFVKKRGVRLAAIVVDPTDSGQGDTTRNAAEADQRMKEIIGKLSQPGSDFASLAREYSEDPSKLQGGDMGYLSEDDLKANYPQLAAGFMNPQFTVGKVTNPIPIQGKYYIFKLQERIEKDENLTLDSPDVRPQINQLLVDNRKQLLSASYQAIAMNEAKIENFLAKKVVDNPNELSGARPAGAAGTPSPDSNSNTLTKSASNSMTSNSANAAVKPIANTAAKPGGTPAKPSSTKPGNAPANK